jgi:hypothetical protein
VRECEESWANALVAGGKPRESVAHLIEAATEAHSPELREMAMRLRERFPTECKSQASKDDEAR